VEVFLLLVGHVCLLDVPIIVFPRPIESAPKENP